MYPATYSMVYTTYSKRKTVNEIPGIMKHVKQICIGLELFGYFSTEKLFLEFVTLIVRNWMYNLLKEEMLRLETSLRDEMKTTDKKPNYMTVPAEIKELEKIEIAES